MQALKTSIADANKVLNESETSKEIPPPRTTADAKIRAAYKETLEYRLSVCIVVAGVQGDGAATAAVAKVASPADGPLMPMKPPINFLRKVMPVQPQPPEDQQAHTYIHT